MKPRIFTIGYTSFKGNNGIDMYELFHILERYNVDWLIDVRSNPYSKQYPECNANNINELVRSGKSCKVRYAHFPELGAKADVGSDVFSYANEIFYEKSIFPIKKSDRPENCELCGNDEIVDFNKFIYTETFREGIKRIGRAYEQDLTLALMCSEKDPIQCHRYFLISKELQKKYKWLEINHIVQISKELQKKYEGRNINHIVQSSNGDYGTILMSDLDKWFLNDIQSKEEFRDIQRPGLTDNSAPIENYHGDNRDEKISDFCMRYWNIMHGWKKNSQSQPESRNCGGWGD